MVNFIQQKSFNNELFLLHLDPAIKTNQFTNGGSAVHRLETQARYMLGISQNKAIIACSNGTSALHAMLYAMPTEMNIITQDFTFPCNAQGPAEKAVVIDVDTEGNIDIPTWLSKPSIIIITNCFGHLQDLSIIPKLENKGHIVILDNAATPYSFYKKTNSCNLGTGAFVSLHHTKPIGFGEGGLAIVDNKYEKAVRAAIDFGKGGYRGSNFKMSEIAAAAILQWWYSFDITVMAADYLSRYNDAKQYFNKSSIFKHYGTSDEFFPNCLPVIHKEITETNPYLESLGIKKYYKPILGRTNSKYIYERILCYPIAK